MSNLFKYTKRVLTSVLAAAVVLTAIPSTAFGAELPDEDIVEAVEVQEAEVADEAAVEEEAAATDGTGNDEEVIIEGEEENPDQFKNEITLALGDVPNKVTGKKASLYHVDDPNTKVNDNPTDLGVDPDNDYSLVVSPDKGYSLINNGDIISKAEYWVVTYDEATDTTNKRKVTLTSGWTVTALDAVAEPGFNRGSYVITFPKSLLTSVADGISYNGTVKRADSGVLTVTFKDDAALATEQTQQIASVTAIGDKVSIRTDYASDTTELKPTANKAIALSQIVKETTFDADSLKVRAVVKDGSKVVTSIVDGTYTLEADPTDVAVTGATDKTVADVFTAGTITSADDLKNVAKKWMVVTPKNYQAGSAHDTTVPNSAIVINKAAIAEIYNAGYTLELVVNGTTAAQTGFQATYAANEFVTWGAKGGDGTGTAPTTVAASGDFEPSIKTKAPSEGTRIVGETWYVQDGKTVKVDSDAVLGADKGDLKWTGVTAINATIYANTYVPVTQADTTDKAHYDIYDADGDAATLAKDGEAFKFTIVVKDGYKVDKVQYRLGGDSDSYVNATESNGVYSTAIVNDNVVIKATLKKDEEVSSVNVKAKTDYTTPINAITVLGITGGVANITDGTDPNAVATVVKNQPFFFTVKANATYLVNSVSYSVGGVNKGTLTAVSKKAGVLTYRIPSASGAVEIAVNTSAAAIVKAPISPKVVVDGFKTGETKSVAKDTMYQFTIRPASDAVTIGAVYAYAVDGTDKATDGDKFTPSDIATDIAAGKIVSLGEVDPEVGYGTFTITPANFTTLLGTGVTTIGIYALTEEEIASSKYKVVFSDTATLADTGSRMKFEHTGSTVTAASITSQEFDPVVSKSTVNMATNSKLYPVNTDGSLGGAITPDAQEWTVASTAEVLSVTTAGVVTAKKVGNETLKVEYTKAESTTAGNAGYSNTLVYNGEVPVVAAELFDSLWIDASVTTIYPLNSAKLADLTAITLDEAAVEIADLSVKAIDGQTKKEVNVGTGGDVKKITWLFNPDITGSQNKDFFFCEPVAATKDVSAANSANRIESYTNKATVKVAAVKDLTTPVKVKAIVTFDDDSELTLDEVAINVVEEPTLNYYVTATLDGVNHLYKNATNDTTEMPIGLVINSENAKTATVEYKVYQSDAAVPPTIATEADLDAALKAGTIEEATGVTLGDAKFAYYNSGNTEQKDKAATDFVTMSGSGNKFSFTAKALTTIAGDAGYVKLTAPSITIGGVAIPELNKAGKDLKMTVAQRAASQAVDLITYDTDTVDGQTVVYESYPKSDFIAGRSVSEVVDTTSAAGTAKYHKRTGIEFSTVTRGTSFKLPTAAEMTQVGSKRTLVGWQQYTDYDGTPVSSNAVYKAPGAYVTVGPTNNFWKAIWAEKYQIAGVMNGNAVKKENDPEDTTKKVDTYQVAVGDTVVGSNVPVMLAVAKPTLNTSETGTTPDIDYTVAANELTYVAPTALALKTGSPTDALDSAKLASKTISGAKVTTGKTITVTASWADPEVTSDVYTADSAAFAVVDPATYTLTLDTAKVELVEGELPRTVTVNAFAKGGASQLPDSVNAYTVEWSVGNSAIATLSDGVTKWSTVVTPKVQSATASTLKVTVTGPDGLKVAEKEIPLTVGEPSAKIVLTDADGKALSDDSVLPVLAGQAGSTATTFKFKVMNGAGTETTTFTSSGIKAATIDNKLLSGKTSSIASDIDASGTGDGSYVVPVYTNNLVDDDVITLEVVKDGVTYSKDLKLSSYFTVGFTAKTTDPYEYVTKNGTRVVDKDGKPKNDEIRLTTSDRVFNKAKTDYTFKNIDIAAYAAEYVDSTGATQKTFSCWQDGSTNKYTTTIDELKKSDFTAGKFALTPVLFQSVELSVSPSTTINLENSTGKTSKKVTLGVKPVSNGLVLKAQADKTGFFKIDPATDAGVTSWTGGVLTLTSKYVDATTPRNDFFTVSITDETADGSDPKAGTAVLSLYSNDVNTQPGDLGTITINVNGLNKDATTGKVTYYENGSLVKNDFRVVDGETYYFDKDGYQITGSGITEINGKKVLIISGKVAQEGTMPTYDGHKYAVGAGGEIQTGWLTATGAAATAATGVYYASPEADTYGQFATGLTTISGKTYFFDASCKLVRATNTAGEYELLSGYYINAAGEVAFAQLIKVSGKQYLVDKNGELVTYAKTTDGKITIDGITYKIDKVTNEAERDDVFYNPQVKWTTSWPTKWDKKDAIPTMAYQVTFTSANTGKSDTTDSIVATVTPATVASDAKDVTFTATADLSSYFQDKAGTKKAENVITQRQYTFKNGGESGQSGQEVDPSGDILIVGLEETYPWTGKQIKPAFKVVDANGNYLAQGVDFTVKYGKNKDAGQGTVTITGKGNYAKTGTAATFSIVKEEVPSDPAGQVNGFDKIAQQTYTGSPIYPDGIVVKLKDKTKVTMEHKGDGVYGNKEIGGKELLVVVTNNVNKGSATVAATGSNGVTKTTTFKINAKSMEGANATGALGNPFEVTISDSADYKIKNTTPEVSIKFNGDELVEGQDYTAKFDAKKGKVTVTGKNNFTKKFVQEGITVNPLNLSDCKLVAVTAYEGLKYTAVKATVLDPDGNLVPAGKYTLTVTPDNDAVGSNGKLIGGKNIKVVAKAKGNDSLITGETSEEDFTVAKNFGKASIKVTGSVVYTGEAIELDDDWVNTNVTVKYSGSVIKCGDDFEIVGYTNNVKKGTMTVYCAGKGDFSGTKNFKVKITPKPLGAK